MSGGALPRSGLAEGHARHARPPQGLDTMLRAGARTRPDAIALEGSPDARAWSFAELDARAASIAGRLAELGLDAGAVAMITGGASPHVLAALLGVGRAGLRAALLPLGAGREGLAAACVAAGAELLVGAGGHAFGDLATLLAGAAADAPCVRFVAVCSGEAAGGFVDLDAPGEPPGTANEAPPSLVTFARGASAVSPVLQTTETVAATAGILRDLLAQDDAPVFSTLPPLTLAGLAAGPCLAWSVNAALHLHGPFDSQAFVVGLRRAGRAHLVIPAALAEPIVAAQGLLPHIVSLTLVHRHADRAALMSVRPPMLQTASGLTVVDLHCLDEHFALPVARDSKGRARPVTEPPPEPDVEARSLDSAAGAVSPAARHLFDATRAGRDRGSL